MKEEDVAAGTLKNVGAILMIIGALGGLIVGMLVATGVAGQQIYGFAGESGRSAVWLAVLPFLIVILVASFMLSGREQFVEEDEDF
jgi:energy-coupling factor transport system substrate-specific component